MEEARFLYLLFGRRFTWAPRIWQLKHWCQKPLDLLQPPFPPLLGASSRTINLLHTSLVLSQIELLPGGRKLPTTSRSYKKRSPKSTNQGLTVDFYTYPPCGDRRSISLSLHSAYLLIARCFFAHEIYSPFLQLPSNPIYL